MLKFLESPAFKFSTDLLSHLTSTDAEEGYKRILAYPIAGGLRFRNLEMSLHVTFEVSGTTIIAAWEEFSPNNDLPISYKKEQLFAITDLSIIAEKIEGFFERKWEIEKDA